MAVDPGKSGGFAWFDGSRTYVASMPLVPSEIPRLIKSIMPKVLVIEQVGGYIKKEAKVCPVCGGANEGQPGSAMFNFGHIAGAPYWVALTLEIPVIPCPPQKWMRRLGMGTKKHYGKKWKDHLLIRASEMHPELKLDKTTADAVLLLQAARQNLI